MLDKGVLSAEPMVVLAATPDSVVLFSYEAIKAPLLSSLDLPNGSDLSANVAALPTHRQALVTYSISDSAAHSEHRKVQHQ